MRSGNRKVESTFYGKVKGNSKDGGRRSEVDELETRVGNK